MIYHRDVCAMPWSKGSNIDYWTLLDTMNNYRKNHDMKLYDFKCPIDFLRCVCGAYTHKHELKFNIDKLIREVHPALSIVMKRLVETFDSSVRNILFACYMTNLDVYTVISFVYSYSRLRCRVLCAMIKAAVHAKIYAGKYLALFV